MNRALDHLELPSAGSRDGRLWSPVYRSLTCCWWSAWPPSR